MNIKPAIDLTLRSSLPRRDLSSLCRAFTHKCIFYGFALSLASVNAVAEPVVVQATILGYSDLGGIDLSGYGSGVLDGDSLKLSGRFDVTGVDESPQAFGFSEEADFTFDFSNDTGSFIAKSCEPLPEATPDCDDGNSYPTEPIEWTTVSGTPTAFTTTLYFEAESDEPAETITVDWVVEELDTVGTTLRLEEPVGGAVHSGIGNLRGWAFNPLGVDRIEIWIDDEFEFTAPYGGKRDDVAAAFPELRAAQRSGFSLAFGYSNLSPGQHTVEARAIDMNGDAIVSLATFTVVAFDQTFIFPNETVDVSGATLNAQGDQISILGALIAGKEYDLLLEWRTAEQGFDFIEID